MPSVRQTDIQRAVLGEVRTELKERQPGDGYRPYDAVRLPTDVRRAFEAESSGKGRDDVVSLDRVVDRYARTLKRSIDAANQVGPKFVTVKEADKVGPKDVGSRVVAARAELGRGLVPLSHAALARRAAQFVAAHSEPIGTYEAPDAAFPGFDRGNGEDWHRNQVPGIDGHVITDAKTAEVLLSFFKAEDGPRGRANLETFDPSRELLVVVRGSGDERHYYAAAIDQQTGKARHFSTYHNEVDFELPQDAAEFDAVFGAGASAAITDDDYEYGAITKLEQLVEAGVPLDLASTQPPEVDRKALTHAGRDAITAFLSSRDTVPTDGMQDGFATTLKAIHAAVRGGAKIDVVDGDTGPELRVPLKFSGAPTPDYYVGWALRGLTENVPELRRFVDVNASPKA